MPRRGGKMSTTIAPHATEWNRVARAEAKNTKQALLAQERPTTTGSGRRSRVSVGITNRPGSVPLIDLVDESKAETSDKLLATVDSAAPIQVVTKNKRMFHRSDKVRSSLYHPSPTWPFEPEKTQDRYLKSIQDKIFRKQLNLNPVLRKLASEDGYISSDDIKQVLSQLRLNLTAEEMEFFTTSKMDPERENLINCEALLKSLHVPDYDHGFYDPLGDFRKREIAYLSHMQHTWREKSQSFGSRRDSLSNSDSNTHNQLSSPLIDVPMQNTATSNLSKYALKRVSDITRKLEKGGVPIFQYSKNIDNGSTGVVRRADLDRMISQYSNPAMVKDQVENFWAQVDQEGSQTLNYMQLQEAMKSVDEPKNLPPRPQSNAPPSTPFSNYPWTETRSVRSPCLPSCHFNVRAPRGGPIRNTAEIIVPDEKAFSYCPDWMRSTTVRLENSWLMDGTGQGNIQQTRKAAKIERIRAANSRIADMVAQREMRVEYNDAARLNGIARSRHDWIAAMQGIWA